MEALMLTQDKSLSCIATRTSKTMIKILKYFFVTGKIQLGHKGNISYAS